MKRIMAVLAMVVVLAMVAGCAGFMQTVCHPTDEQIKIAADAKAQALTLLAYLQSQIPDARVQAAILAVQAAIINYDKVLADICVAADVIQAEINSVNAQKTMAVKMMGYKGK